MRESLLPEHRKALKPLERLLDEGGFYLAGGTGVYYHLEHRESLDLDFFSSKAPDFARLGQALRNTRVLSLLPDTLHCEVAGIKVSFFHYPYPLLRPLLNLDTIRLASLEDILCMKVLSIIQRGSRKDFTDVYFILQKIEMGPGELVTLFQQKYGAYNELILYKALVFFEDADAEPDLRVLRPVSWDTIKQFFLNTFSRLP